MNADMVEMRKVMYTKESNSENTILRNVNGHELYIMGGNKGSRHSFLTMTCPIGGYSTWLVQIW